MPQLPEHENCSGLDLGAISLWNADALELYGKWETPSVIISDGPYGLGKFPGEPRTPDGLADWYAPHAAEWAKYSAAWTTLWFWNSEIGWAKAHPALEMHGWEYQETVIWNKGIAHIAGNVNSKTIRGLPVVTEVAVRYTRRVTLPTIDGSSLPIKQWLRHEWQRSGLPMSQSNAACGVANAATRKYLTRCHLWYFPPGDAVVAMANWCSRFGRPTDRPYFSLDGKAVPTADAWDGLRARWNHVHGRTNVWDEPPVHGQERIKSGDSTSYLHANQKPLALMERQILASSGEGDIVWEPFGGLMSATLAAMQTKRRAYAAEVDPAFFTAAKRRIVNALPDRFVRMVA